MRLRGLATQEFGEAEIANTIYNAARNDARASSMATQDVGAHLLQVRLLRGAAPEAEGPLVRPGVACPQIGRAHV